MILKAISNKSGYARIVRTAVYYLLTWLLIRYLERASPSGPCSPGLGVLALLVFFPLTIMLFVATVYSAVAKDKAYWGPAIMHMTALIILYFYFW